MGGTRWRASLFAVAMTLAASCASGGTPADRAAIRPRTTSPAHIARYAVAGPYKVGYTTLRMDDRFVDVWYPADSRATAGEPKATYDQTTPLPANLKSFVPRDFNTVVTMNAYADVTGSAEGPFPVVLFSHGAGAYRMASSRLLAGIASWGFIVVSAEYAERGVVTQLPGQAPATIDPARDKRVMLDTLNLIIAEGSSSTSVVQGLVDQGRVAAVGHSAGGTTAFDALADPRIKAAVVWASLGPTSTPAHKPTMIIGAGDDPVVTPEQVAKTFRALPSPKREVEIAGAGHNSFTDLCLVTRTGGGMVSYAIKNGLVSDAAAKLLLSGCEKSALPVERVWPIVQHFTVAELRTALGIDADPVGLDADITQAFPAATVTYVQS